MSDYEDFPVKTDFRDKLIDRIAREGGQLTLDDIVIVVEVKEPEKPEAEQ